MILQIAPVVWFCSHSPDRLYSNDPSRLKPLLESMVLHVFCLLQLSLDDATSGHDVARRTDQLHTQQMAWTPPYPPPWCPPHHSRVFFVCGLWTRRAASPVIYNAYTVYIPYWAYSMRLLLITFFGVEVTNLLRPIGKIVLRFSVCKTKSFVKRICLALPHRFDGQLTDLPFTQNQLQWC